MIRSDAGRCPVSAQCGILGVAKSTCYWVLEHPEAERADPYEKDVERVWRDSGKVYGARKIRHALGHEGVTLSRRRINRIMKGNGMAGSCSKAALCFVKLGSAFCAVFFRSVGSGFSAGCAVSAAACLRCVVVVLLVYLVMRACSLL